MAYRIYLGGILLPVAPSELTISSELSHEKKTLLDGNTVRVLQAPGLTQVRFRAMLPHVPYPFADYRGAFVPAAVYINQLNALRDQAFAFRLERNGRADLAFCACLDQLVFTEETDVEAEITVTEYRPWTTGTARTAGVVSPQSYTTVAGDTLWNLARRFLGDGARYTEIFALNREKIPRANKLTPGTVLRMPEVQK
mgnify:CR=1 FL=1